MDVAKLANVSISTVSRVLNQTAPVADSTVRRVEEAIDILGFQPDPAARSLAGSKTRTLGILLPGLTNPFFSLLMSGVEQSVRDADFDLLIYLTSIARLQGGRHLLPLNEHNTNGLLIYTDALTSKEIKRLYDQDFPMTILFETVPDNLTIPTVTIDNIRGARLAVDHLIEDAGRRRIAFLRELLGNTDSAEREIGYRQSLEDHGIEVDEALIVEGDYGNESCQPVIQQWLEQPDSIDAIFADCDRLAVQVVENLHQANVNIPQQVSVVGFDDVTMTKHMNPPLTTVRSPIAEAGRRAIELLVQQIETGKTESCHLSTELVVRDSSVVKK